MSNIKDAEVEAIIGYKFKNATLLQRALTHSSIDGSQQLSEGVGNYQRLEYLGDALLDFLVAEELFKLYPSYNEGELTKIRSNIVSKTPLAEVITSVGIVKYIIKFNLDVNAISEKVKSDIFEALLCAIYLDSNSLENARNFVLRFLGVNIQKARTVQNYDYKSILLEYCAAKQIKAEFNLLGVSGPPHALTFEFNLCIDDKIVSTASSATKRGAQQDCAKQACAIYNINNR